VSLVHFVLLSRYEDLSLVYKGHITVILLGEQTSNNRESYLVSSNPDGSREFVR